MLSVRGALGLYLFAFAAMLSAGAALGAYGLVGVAGAEWLCVAAPTLAVIGLGPGHPVEVLRLRAPRAAGVWAGVLVGISAWVVLAYGVVPLQEQVAPAPRALAAARARCGVPAGSLLGPLLAVALTPAICEELLCRGALLPALRARIGPAAAVIASALLFGALHFSPYRLLPTFLLGVSFGALALATGSTLPSMIAHALNNAAVVLVSSRAATPLRDRLESHSAVAVGAAVIVLTIAHALVSRRRGRPPPEDR